MSLKFNLKKSKKPKAFISDGLDLSDLFLLVDKEDTEVRYIKPEVNGYTDGQDDSGFCYLGEISLKLCSDSLKDVNKISYNNELDLNRKIIEYIRDNALGIYKDNNSNSPVNLLFSTVNSKVYDQYCRGELNVMLCSEKFLETHNNTHPYDDYKVIIRDYLPDDQALFFHKYNVNCGSDVPIMLYINKKAKFFKIKILSNYTYLVQS